MTLSEVLSHTYLTLDRNGSSNSFNNKNVIKTTVSGEILSGKEIIHKCYTSATSSHKEENLKIEVNNENTCGLHYIEGFKDLSLYTCLPYGIYTFYYDVIKLSSRSGKNV